MKTAKHHNLGLVGESDVIGNCESGLSISWSQIQLKMTRLNLALALYSATFQKYQSLKANGVTSVSIDQIVEDYEKCEKHNPQNK